MADDQTLKIQIVTEADNSGFKSAAAASSDLNREMGVVNVSQEDAARITKKVSEATEHETIKQKELKEIIGKLTAEYPILGEVARMALDPIVIGVAGPVVAFEIWTKKVEELTKAMGGIELPDLTSGLDQAKNLREEWKGIAEAVKKANEEFNSPESTFKRTEDDIGKKADSDKKLNDLAKRKALANLDLNKGNLTETQYDVAKAGIENFYAQKDYNIDAQASTDRSAAKAKEVEAADQRRRETAAKLDSYKLPATKEEFEAQQEALKKSSEAYREQAKGHDEEVKKMRELQERARGSTREQLFAIPAAIGYGFKHGAESPEDFISLNENSSRDAKSKAAAIEKETQRRQKLFDEREVARGDAASAAGAYETLTNETFAAAPGLRRDRATAATLNRGNQDINVSGALANITQGGAHVEKAVDAVGAALARRDAATAAKLQELSRQIHAAPSSNR